MPCIKRVYRDKKGVVPRMNRLSTADFVPLSVYIGYCFFVLLEGRWGDNSLMLCRESWISVAWANDSVGTQSSRTPPRCSAGRSEATHLCYIRVSDATSSWSAGPRASFGQGCWPTNKCSLFLWCFLSSKACLGKAIEQAMWAVF